MFLVVGPICLAYSASHCIVSVEVGVHLLRHSGNLSDWLK